MPGYSAWSISPRQTTAWSRIPGTCHSCAPRERRGRRTIEHFPIADTRVPRSMVAFDQLVHTLARDVAAGIPIAVHCWGGVGRTGMVAAALLVRFGWPVHEALTEVNRLWRATPKVARDHHRTRTAPETEEQCAFVEQWARECAVDAPVLRPRSGLSARDARGCLLGGALGDALGAAVEFMDLTAIRARYGAAGRHPSRAGVWREQSDHGRHADDAVHGRGAAARRTALRAIPDDASFEDVMGHAYVRWLITQDERAVPAHHARCRDVRDVCSGTGAVQRTSARQYLSGGAARGRGHHRAQCAWRTTRARGVAP
jgi:hypothetical protein